MVGGVGKVPDDPCAIARSLGVLGERWTLLILREASRGADRFSQFREALGVAPDVLAERLGTLVAYGVMEKVPYQEPGERARASYRLTPPGEELAVVLAALQQWGDEHLPWPDGPSILRRTKDRGQPARTECPVLYACRLAARGALVAACAGVRLRRGGGHLSGPDPAQRAGRPGSFSVLRRSRLAGRRVPRSRPSAGQLPRAADGAAAAAGTALGGSGRVGPPGDDPRDGRGAFVLVPARPRFAASPVRMRGPGPRPGDPDAPGPAGAGCGRPGPGRPRRPDPAARPSRLIACRPAAAVRRAAVPRSGMPGCSVPG
jgi:DNA-binding HxlR family transcriptional regulator